MKRLTLILSLLSPVLLFVVGGFFFAISGFGFDTEAPPTSPQRIIGALIGYIPGLALALIALGMSLLATARSQQIGWFIGLLVWPVVPVLAGVLMVVDAVGFSDSWWLAAVFVPLATLLYAVIGPAPVDAPAPLLPTGTPADMPGSSSGAPVATSRGGIPGATGSRQAPSAQLLVFIGSLALVTLVGFATLTRGALPLAPLPDPTPTVGPPPFSLTTGSATANCATGTYPAVTITNTGSVSLTWSARSSDANVVVTPASGSLSPGASSSVTLTGHSTALDLIITFTTSSGQNVAKIACAST